MPEYGPPVAQLLRLGADEALSEDWLDYLALGLGSEQVPDLIRMAGDPALIGEDAKEPEVFGRIHAWRALGQLRSESAVSTLVGLVADQDKDGYDDWITGELPTVFGMIGPAAIPELTALLERESATQYARSDAVLSLAEIGKVNPDARAEVVAVLTRNLERAEGRDSVLNAWMISKLIALGAKESAEVIERALAGGFVDDSITGTWHEVWHALRLEGEPPPKTERKYSPFGPDSSSKNLVAKMRSLLDKLAAPPPPGRRAAADRKVRNKARQKLERKRKGRKSR